MQIYYRCHLSSLPFSPENAYSSPWGTGEDGTCGVCQGVGKVEKPYQDTCWECGGAGEGCGCDHGIMTYYREVPCPYCQGTGKAKRLRGYSCFKSPEALSNYFFLRGGMSDNATVVIFTGEQVGVGPDGEPLVVPKTFPRPRFITWGQMQDILVRRQEIPASPEA